MRRKLSDNGFAIMELIIVLALFIALGLGSWYVWHTQHDGRTDKSSRTSTSKSSTRRKSSGSQQPTDPYAGWKTYSSSTYGMSFKYPADWKVGEGAVTSSDSATKQEYAVNLKRSEDVKYNDTVNVEVLDESLSAATAWYDNSFAQSSSNTVNKTTDALKGKQSVQYVVSNNGVDSKVYLFGVGSKTYVFSSINEELNVQADSGYWTKFGKVFDSLQI